MGEDRFIDLEIKISYQEDLIQALNEVVSNQQSQINRLEEVCRLLNERIKYSVENQGINQGEEVPPHY